MLRKLTAGLVASAALVGIGAGAALAARHPHARPTAAVSRDSSSLDRHSRDMHGSRVDTQRDR